MPFYKNIASTLFNEENPICRSDENCDACGPSYFLNNSPDESICYYFICSLYWRIYDHENHFPEDYNIFENINTEENYVLLSDFFMHIVHNRPKKKEFKSDTIEIREGINQNEKYFCIKIGNINTQQYTFTFSSDILYTAYEYREYCTKDCLLKNKTKKEVDEIYAAQFYLNTILYCATFNFYQSGIFYDDNFLDAKPY